MPFLRHGIVFEVGLILSGSRVMTLSGGCVEANASKRLQLRFDTVDGFLAQVVMVRRVLRGKHSEFAAIFSSQHKNSQQEAISWIEWACCTNSPLFQQGVVPESAQSMVRNRGARAVLYISSWISLCIADRTRDMRMGSLGIVTTVRRRLVLAAFVSFSHGRPWL